MKDFSIENGVLQGYYGNKKNVVIPKNVTTIGGYAFCRCRNLLSVKIPNNVKTIGWGAFDWCENLTRIEIPSSVTEIDLYAFNEIKNVKPQYKPNGALRAFKAFNNDWTCRGFQYEVGKSFHMDGKIEICHNGFHACPNPLEVFNYYSGKLSTLHFAEVELSGEMNGCNVKVAASDIKIVRELSVSELAEIYNSMEKE